MATSARTAALANQKNPYSSYRILAPRDTKINTIAHQNAQSELSIMVERYNDGIVGNEEMQSFLSKQLTNPGFTASEIADVQNYIRDFDLKIRKDKLEAIYKAAPEYSLEKVTAAQALSNYFSQRAATLSPGTPAQSQALQNASDWNQTAVTEKDNIEKKARQNYRYTQETTINQTPTGTSENAYAKAQMYSDLAQQAQTDGDTTEALRLASLQQQYQTLGDQYVQKEAETATKEDQKQVKTNITNYLGDLENKYHDGSIDENQYLQALSEVQTYVDASNDYGLINRFNRITDTVQKNLEKGGLLRGTTATGLPVVLGKGPAGGQSTDWDKQDYDYSDNLKTVEEQFRSGNIDANKYSELVGKILSERQSQLDGRTAVLEAKAQVNPNEKVMYEGRKQRVSDVLTSIYKQSDELDPQIQAYQNGTFRLMEVAPDSTTKTGKSTAQYRLIDVNAIPENERDQYAEDDSGVLHSIIRQQLNLTPDQMNDPAQVANGYYTDPTSGQSQPVKYDSAGNPYIYGKSQVNIYKPGSNEKVTVDYVEGQPIKSWASHADEIQTQAEQAWEKANTPKEQAPVLTPNLDTRNIIQKAQEAIQPTADVIKNKIGEITTPVTEAIKSLPQPLQQAPVQAIANKLPAQIQAPVQSAIKTVQQSPIQYVASKTINAPSYSAPSTPPSGGTYKPTIQVNNQTMVKQYDPNQGITYQPLKAPAPTPAPQPSLGTKIMNVVKQSPFNFLKSLF
jgi:hypothetical protein